MASHGVIRTVAAPRSSVAIWDGTTIGWERLRESCTVGSAMEPKAKADAEVAYKTATFGRAL